MDYKTFFEAHAEAQRIKKEQAGNDIMVKVEKSPYGGFRVKLIPVNLSLDLVTNGILNGKSKQSTSRY